jgi:DNA-directed RNA polymerase subunit K/omega
MPYGGSEMEVALKRAEQLRAGAEVADDHGAPTAEVKAER